jgi:hypothetical protein
LAQTQLQKEKAKIDKAKSVATANQVYSCNDKKGFEFREVRDLIIEGKTLAQRFKDFELKIQLLETQLEKVENKLKGMTQTW